ncbi:MFS transporter [Clostridium nigeriense]|uniref:MFS transporter n=1 Tax=Clostridium nigeriense TaxID=1805470 RepID=UPI003D333722
MNKRVNIHLLNIIIFLQGFVFYAPIATIYRENRGISISQIFLIESIYMIGIIFLEIPWGVFADKFGYKKTLVLANFIFLMSKVIFFKANSFYMFLFERLLLAVAISGLSGCDSTLLYLSLDKEENSERAFAKYEFFSNLGFLLGSFMSTFIINISMDLSAFFTIIPYAFASFISLFLKDINIKGEERVGIVKNIKNILKKKEILFFIVGIALISEVVQSITVFLNQNIYIRSNIDIKYFGVLLATIQIISLLSVKSYKITNKLGQIKSIMLLLVIILISSFILIFTNNFIIAFSGIALISTSMDFISPISLDIENKSITSIDRATVLSIYSMIGSVISAGINPIIGVASNYSLEMGLIICCVIGFISIILISIYKVRIDL